MDNEKPKLQIDDSNERKPVISPKSDDLPNKGPVREWNLWEPRMRKGSDGQMIETGVCAPDGNYYQLQDGERFVIRDKTKDGDYEAVVIDSQGQERFLRKSLARRKADQEQTDNNKMKELRGQLGLEHKDTEGQPNLSRAIFENVYDQIKPQLGQNAEKAAKNFINDLEKGQNYHLEKIDENSPVDQSLEKIWTEGIAVNLRRWSADQKEFEKRKGIYTEQYLKLKEHVENAINSGDVEPYVAKVFLENLRVLKSSIHYNAIVRNAEEMSEAAQKKYGTAFEDIYSDYGEDKVIEKGGFFHFNRKENKGAKVKNRFYLGADLSGSPDNLINAWKDALAETGLQDKIYFKLLGQLAKRHETIIVYQTENVSDEDMGKVMGAFDKKCPQEARAKKNMPTGAPLARGISYAPEPKNINELFKAMNLKEADFKDEHITISYNNMISGLTELSFELAYKDFVSTENRKPMPKDLKSGATKYFEQLIRLAGINPETMVPYSQGGKLPEWAERMTRE